MKNIIRCYGLIILFFINVTVTQATINHSINTSNHFFEIALNNLKTNIQNKFSAYSNTAANSAIAPVMMASFNYSNTTTASLSGQTDCNTQLSRTFNVSDEFIISDLNVGLNVEHSYRGDLKIQLTSPTGTTINLINQVGDDSDDNFNLLFDDASTNPADDGVATDPLSPLYGANRTAAPHSALSNFNGQNALGTWTLTFCNLDSRGGDPRTLDFNSAELFFEGTTANSCTIYSVDIVTNCNDNGTVSVNDDYYTITIQPNGLLISSTYSVHLSYGANIANEMNLSYSSAQTLSTQIPVGVHTDFVITDDADSGCLISGRMVSPSECSTPFNCWAIADEGNPDVLFRYDSDTNDWTEIDDSGVDGIEALAYNPFDGVIYTANFDNFGFVNPTTGVFTAIGAAIGNLDGAEGMYNIQDIDGMTFDPFTGILWASERREDNDTDNDYIFQIDITTGNFIPDAFGSNMDYAVVPEIFDPVNGQNVYDLDDIAIDPYDGSLYAISNQGGTGGVLTRLNKSDGTVAEVIGNFGEVDDIEALGFYNSGNMFGSTGNNSPDPADLNRYFFINKIDASLTERAQIDPTGTEQDFESCDCLTGGPNTIVGTVFNDFNANGELTGGELGEGAVLVYLYRDIDADSIFTEGIDILLDTVSTNPDGTYEFMIASTGDFVLNINTNDLPDGNFMTTDNMESALFVGVSQTNANNDFGFTLPCDLSITNNYADNCTGDDTNGYTAALNIGIATNNAPDNNISYQRNSNAIQTHTLTGTTDTLTFSNVPADGGLYDTLKVWFTNETTCGDTIILKRPAPCPAPIAGANAPAEVCNGLSNTEIGGTAFEDWNYDGAMNQSDTIGVQGVQVNLYDDCGNVSQITYTDANGNYEFTGLTDGTTYRVEFSLPTSVACWAKPTQAGADNGTTVQFVQPGNCASLGLAAPQDYCETNPRIAIACFENGTGDGNTNDGLVSFFYNASGLPVGYETSTEPTTTPGTAEVPQTDATIDAIGAVSGTAWQASEQRLFLASLTKRYVGFNDGPGYVYAVAYNNGTAAAPVGFDLQGLSPANGGAAIDVGEVCREPACASEPGRTGIFSDYELPDAPTAQSIDLDAFGKVGKTAFGDADISEDGKTLYLVNLHQRAIITVDISGATGSLPGTVNQYLLDDLLGLPSCSNGTLRPWALAFEKGRGYLGAVCDAAISQDSSDLMAHVLSFDPNQIENGFSTEISFSLNYNRENGQRGDQTSNMFWQPWANTWSELDTFTNGSDNNLMAPQPIIGDIVFNERGDMTIGMMDRFAHQNGRANLIAVSQTTQSFDTNAGGDLIQVCRANNSWALEGAAGCPVNDDNITGDPLNQLLQNDGASNNGEFFYEDYFTEDTLNTAEFTHAETANGLLNLIKGTGEVVSTHYDPLWGPPRIVNSQGIVFHSTYTGARTDAYQIVKSTGSDPQTFAKANGLGDLQSMCEAAPIEIGNYVWIDSDGDGIQDACEQPLAGVIVALYDTLCNEIAYDTTDVNGQYYFNNQTIRADNQPLELNPNDDYLVIFGALNQFNIAEGTLYDTLGLTVANVGFGDNADLNDSDGMINNTGSGLGVCTGGRPFIWAKTGDAGCVDHSFDIGFVPERCSLEIISATQTCQDNGTGGNSNDDYFILSLDVSVENGGVSNMFEVVNTANSEIIGTGTYGATLMLEWADMAQTMRFAADGVSTYNLMLRDVDDNTCTEMVITLSEVSCSICPPEICLPIKTTVKRGGGTN